MSRPVFLLLIGTQDNAVLGAAALTGTGVLEARTPRPQTLTGHWYDMWRRQNTYSGRRRPVSSKSRW